MKRLAVLLIPLVLAACAKEQRPERFQGYAEAEYLRVAAPYAGRITQVAVEKGAQVQAGAPLFRLEAADPKAARDEVAQQLARAQARLADLTKGRRPDEIAAIQARIRQAQAAAQLAQVDLARQEALAAKGFVAPGRVDEARSALARERNRVAEGEAELRQARLPARADERAAAQADVDAARAALEGADWRLAERGVSAPAAGRVEERLYRAGEWVGAGTPVISLLPPENIKLRFFVPEPALARVKVGAKVNVYVDGIAQPIAATVNFVAREADYTPPVIYSRDARAKLSFLVEAVPAPADAVKLHPGTPVDVGL